MLEFLWLYNHRTIICNYINACCQFTDIDECIEGFSWCHQHCTDTVPGCTCFCNTGYTLNEDGHACDGETNILLHTHTPHMVLLANIEREPHGWVYSLALPALFYF